METVEARRRAVAANNRPRFVFVVLGGQNRIGIESLTTRNGNFNKHIDIYIYIYLNKYIDIFYIIVAIPIHDPQLRRARRSLCVI